MDKFKLYFEGDDFASEPVVEEVDGEDDLDEDEKEEEAPEKEESNEGFQ